MRPTFMGFETARKGMIASQKGLDITGHNLTNMYTPGYTRQRVDLVSIAQNSYRSRYATNRTDFAGQGADINGVSQTRDQFLDKRFRDQYGEVGYYDKATEIMSEIESAISEKNDAGLSKALQDITSALNNFASNASSETNANILAVNFKNLTQILHQFDTKLNDVAEQQRFDLENNVQYVNTLLEKIANLNETISEDIGASRGTNGEYYGPNELMDQRNLLFDELSQFGDFDVTTHPNGSTTVKMNGKTVVDHKSFTNIKYSTNKEKGTVSLTWRDDGKPVALTKGSLRSSVDYINGRGPNVREADESSTKGILYYKDKLDTFAQTLVTEMNNIIPDEQTGLFKQLLGARVLNANGDYETIPNGKVTASNIALSDKWLEDSSYVMYKHKEGGRVPIPKGMLDSGFKFVTAGSDFSGEGNVEYSFSDSYDPTATPAKPHSITVKAVIGGVTYVSDPIDPANMTSAKNITLKKAGAPAASKDNFTIEMPTLKSLEDKGIVKGGPEKAYSFDSYTTTDVLTIPSAMQALFKNPVKGANFAGNGKGDYTVKDLYDPTGNPAVNTHTLEVTFTVGPGEPDAGKVYKATINPGDAAKTATFSPVGGGAAGDEFTMDIPSYGDLVSSDLVKNGGPEKAYEFKKFEKTDEEAVKSKDNTYILQMLDVLSKNESIEFSENDDGFVGSFSQFVLDYSTNYATETNFNTTRLEASANIADDLNNRRDSFSGVSEIEETSSMMMYSKSYQASARLMTTLDEALDVLINKTGLVGR